MPDRTPWPTWLSAAARAGVAPAAFWRLSLAEWRALFDQPHAHILARNDLHALMARFPDGNDDTR